jgi:hypothetical protein
MTGSDGDDEALRKRLVWLAQQKELPERAPRWLGALIVAFQAMDVDDPEHDLLAETIDAIEARLNIDGEFLYDYVGKRWEAS